MNFQNKKVYGFDLDDTLHFFRKASRAAMQAVFLQIRNEFGVSIETMEKIYDQILIDQTANAFTEGKKSTDYRKERFTVLLQKCAVVHPENFMNQILALYEKTLKDNLKLKEGAVELLELLKKKDRKIIIFTEGPEDAQRWTVTNLGIDHLVDELVTTNKYRMSKKEGLVLAFLENSNINPEDFVYIGDSYERDIAPLLTSDVTAYHLSENKVSPHALAINSIQEFYSQIRISLDGGRRKSLV